MVLTERRMDASRLRTAYDPVSARGLLYQAGEPTSTSRRSHLV